MTINQRLLPLGSSCAQNDTDLGSIRHISLLGHRLAVGHATLREDQALLYSVEILP